MGLQATGSFRDDPFTSGDLVLVTLDKTPPRDSLQYQAALAMAKHWPSFSWEQKEAIWTRTCLTRDFETRE